MRKLFAVLLIGLLVGCASNARPNQPVLPTAAVTPELIERETTRLNEWFDARFEEQLDFSPQTKTRLGRKDDYDKLNDVSETAQDMWFEWRRQTVSALTKDFDYALLTPEAKISYDLWVYQLERAEAALPFRRRGYIFNQMGGPHTDLPQFLITFHRVDNEADMVAYIVRIREAARAIEQWLARTKLAAVEGVHAPRFAYEIVLEESRGLVTGAPFGGTGSSPLWADANTKIDALAASGEIDVATAEALRTDAETALTERFKPSYDALIAWIEADLPNTDEIATGVWTLPDGSAYYQERLANQTTTGMTADEIHSLGLREVARIKAEMETLKEQVGFDGNLQAFFSFLRDDPQFYFPNTDEGREGYLQAARDSLGLLQERLPEYFGILPRAGLVVKRVEAFREQPGAAQHYVRGTPDGSRPGTYYAHLIDMRAMPKPKMEGVAYHEGIPGHHMQISIAQELTGVPTFRTQSGFTAFTEGWALYAESLAKEMGAYEDPYSDFGRLSSEI